MAVPVGFQAISCEVHMRAKDGMPPETLERLRMAAERCCVVQQTLYNPPAVLVSFES